MEIRFETKELRFLGDLFTISQAKRITIPDVLRSSTFYEAYEEAQRSRQIFTANVGLSIHCKDIATVVSWLAEVKCHVPMHQKRVDQLAADLHTTGSKQTNNVACQPNEDLQKLTS